MIFFQPDQVNLSEVIDIGCDEKTSPRSLYIGQDLPVGDAGGAKALRFVPSWANVAIKVPGPDLGYRHRTRS